MGAASVDFLVCHKGRFLAIETKAGKGKPTLRQEQTMTTMAAAGAKCLLINEVEGWEELEGWLR